MVLPNIFERILNRTSHVEQVRSVIKILKRYILFPDFPFKDKYQNSETSRSGKRDMVECLIALALRFFVGGGQSSRI